MSNRLETGFERAMFASRWILAPLYMGMVLALVAILVVFAKELFNEFAHLAALEPAPARHVHGVARHRPAHAGRAASSRRSDRKAAVWAP